MTRDILADAASDPEALDAIRDVMEGRIEPLDGVSRLSGRWVPVEALSGPREVQHVRTRTDSLDALCEAAIQLLNAGRDVEARRLSRLAWMLAQRLQNRDAMVQCAATLAQALTGDRSAARERLELLEFVVPAVLEWERPATMKAVMLAFLADARFHEAKDDRGVCATIAACNEALQRAADLDGRWERRLHYIAGTSYDELARDESDLREAVAHLRQALIGAPDDERASTLHNLGNALRDLGVQAGDAESLASALEVYDEALPLRKGDRDREMTVKNRALAERALADLDAAVSHVDDPPDEVWRRLRAGDTAFSVGPQEADKDAHRKGAAPQYVVAASLVGRDAPARLRAEVMHRLAGLFLDWDDDDKLWTGVCFANAARRSAADWREVSRARIDAHMGEMLAIIGYLGDPEYLRRGEGLLRGALQVLATEASPAEAERTRQVHEMCRSMLSDVA